MEEEAPQVPGAPDAHIAPSLQWTLKKEEGPQDGLVTMPFVRTGGRLLPRRLCSPCWPRFCSAGWVTLLKGCGRHVSVWICKSLPKRNLSHRHILTLSQLSGKHFLMVMAYPADDQVILTPASDTSGKPLLNSTSQTGKPTISPQTCLRVVR